MLTEIAAESLSNRALAFGCFCPIGSAATIVVLFRRESFA